MRTQIEILHQIARKKERRIIGLMSGTSLDGLDIALCKIKGAGVGTEVRLERFASIAYSADFVAQIRKVFAQQVIDFQVLTILNVQIAQQHAAMVNQCLEDWGIEPAEVDLLASHGQTVFHAPKSLHQNPSLPNATLQIGDGDHLAIQTGLITISDFRQKHVAVGGEGAPLAMYGDYFLFSKPGVDRFLVNIGGIANFTYLPADGNPAQVFASDTGPGNTLMDFWARTSFDQAYDKDGVIAAAGIVDKLLLDKLKAHPYLQLALPKTTGPEMFSGSFLDSCLQNLPKGHLNPFNIMATLVQFTAETLVADITKTTSQRKEVYLSGGGAHHPGLVEAISALLPTDTVQNMSALGMNGDAKEAVLFAVLANETVAGDSHAGAILGGIPLVGMGKISLPG